MNLLPCVIVIAIYLTSTENESRCSHFQSCKYKIKYKDHFKMRFTKKGNATICL